MHPLLIMLSGMIAVVGGILWLRLHAFLALLLGACLVAFRIDSRPMERTNLPRTRRGGTRARADFRRIGAAG